MSAASATTATAAAAPAAARKPDATDAWIRSAAQRLANPTNRVVVDDLQFGSTKVLDYFGARCATSGLLVFVGDAAPRDPYPKWLFIIGTKEKGAAATFNVKLDAPDTPEAFLEELDTALGTLSQGQAYPLQVNSPTHANAMRLIEAAREKHGARFAVGRLPPKPAIDDKPVVWRCFLATKEMVNAATFKRRVESLEPAAGTNQPKAAKPTDK